MLTLELVLTLWPRGQTLSWKGGVCVRFLNLMCDSVIPFRPCKQEDLCTTCILGATSESGQLLCPGREELGWGLPPAC